jgi:hypothetical protein
VCIGTSATNSFADGAIIGHGASTNTAAGGVAVGRNALAGSGTGESTAIGYYANALDFGIAIGGRAKNARNGEITTTCKYYDSTTTNQYLICTFRSSAITTDATETEIYTMAGGANYRISVLARSAITFNGEFVARCDADNDCKSWTFAGTIQRNNSNTTALVTAITPAVRDATAGASAWTIAVTADDTDDFLKITVTGASGKTIRWCGKVEGTEVRNSV